MKIKKNLKFFEKKAFGFVDGEPTQTPTHFCFIFKLTNFWTTGNYNQIKERQKLGAPNIRAPKIRSAESFGKN